MCAKWAGFWSLCSAGCYKVACEGATQMLWAFGWWNLWPAGSCVSSAQHRGEEKDCPSQSSAFSTSLFDFSLLVSQPPMLEAPPPPRAPRRQRWRGWTGMVTGQFLGLRQWCLSTRQPSVHSSRQSVVFLSARQRFRSAGPRLTCIPQSFSACCSGSGNHIILWCFVASPCVNILCGTHISHTISSICTITYICRGAMQLINHLLVCNGNERSNFHMLAKTF